MGSRRKRAKGQQSLRQQVENAEEDKEMELSGKDSVGFGK